MVEKTGSPGDTLFRKGSRNLSSICGSAIETRNWLHGSRPVGQSRAITGRNIEMDPKAANAFFALSEIYLRQNKISEAEKVLNEGLAIEDRSFLGHLNLARVNWEKAKQIKDLSASKTSS